VSGIEVSGGNLKAVDPYGRETPVQVLSIQGNLANIIFYATEVPAHGYMVHHIKNGTPPQNPFSVQTLIDGSVQIGNGLIDLTVNGDGLTSLKHMGAEQIAPGGIANGLRFYYDEGGLWRLGGEMIDKGCKYDLKNLPDEIPPMLDIVEIGPVRAKIRITNMVSGKEFIRDISLVAGEQTVSMTTTGTAPKNFTVTASFDTNAEFSNAEMAIPYGTTFRSLTGPWRELYHPAHEYFAPLLLDGTAKIAFTARGAPAWKANSNGKVECILFRNSQTSCEIYGPNGTDDLSHTIEYALYFPEQRDSITSRAVPGFAFNSPLRGIVTNTHTGELPPSYSLFTIDDEGAWVHSAKWRDGKVFLRILRLDPKLKQIKIKGINIPFSEAFMSNLFLTENQKLEISEDGTITVPLSYSVHTVLLK